MSIVTALFSPSGKLVNFANIVGNTKHVQRLELHHRTWSQLAMSDGLPCGNAGTAVVYVPADRPIYSDYGIFWGKVVLGWSDDNGRGNPQEITISPHPESHISNRAMILPDVELAGDPEPVDADWLLKNTYNLEDGKVVINIIVAKSIWRWGGVSYESYFCITVVPEVVSIFLADNLIVPFQSEYRNEYILQELIEADAFTEKWDRLGAKYTLALELTDKRKEVNDSVQRTKLLTGQVAELEKKLEIKPPEPVKITNPGMGCLCPTTGSSRVWSIAINGCGCNEKLSHPAMETACLTDMCKIVFENRLISLVKNFRGGCRSLAPEVEISKLMGVLIKLDRIDIFKYSSGSINIAVFRKNDNGEYCVYCTPNL